MSSLIRGASSALPFAAALLALAGCARLTIEVDVYKGPLSNQESVQVEELSVMAIGARPLLIQLRDQLEAGGRHVTLGAIHKMDWYSDRYEPAPEDREPPATKLPIGHPCYPYFQDPWARRVQAVLGLYEDRSSDPLQEVANGAFDAFYEYRAAAEVLAVSDRDRLIWRQILEQMDDDARDPGTAEGRLAAAFGQLLAPGEHEYRRAEGCLRACLADDRLRGLVAIGGQPLDTPDVGANAAFAALSNRPLVEAVAAILLDGRPDRELFVDRVLTVAWSFNAARSALERAFRHALEYLRSATSDDSPMAAQRRSLAASAVAMLMGSYYLRMAFDDPTTAVEAKAYLRPRLWPTLEKTDADIRTADSRGARDAAVQRYRNTVEALVRYDSLAAQAILDIHDSFIDRYAPTSAEYREYSTEPSRWIASLRRQYGLVVGPPDTSPKDNSELSSQVLTLDEAEVIARGADEGGGSQGLGTGRLDVGLDRMIRDYLESRYNHRPENDVAQARDRLLDALVRFAEKLRFIASFDVLTGSARELRDYTETLAAISNSILTTVDALRANEQYRESQATTAATEREIRDRTLIARNLPRDEDQTTKDVLDALITSLRYRLIEATQNGEPPERIAAIRDALDVALDQRSTLVQIRPAAAFLRSSYITTSVQAGTEGAKTDRSVAAIDRQFWQRVNTIELSGTGDTQYVLAKDDIGNWYVKSFQADPEKIIQSAKNLALFAAAGSVSPVALAQAQTLLGPRGADVAQDQQTQREAVIGALLRDEDARASEAFEATVAALKDRLAGMEEALEQVWQGELEGDATLRSRKLAALRAVMLAHPFETRIDEPAGAGPELFRVELRRLAAHGRTLVGALTAAGIRRLLEDYERFRTAKRHLKDPENAEPQDENAIAAARKELDRARAVRDFTGWDVVEPALSGGSGAEPITFTEHELEELREETGEWFQHTLDEVRSDRLEELSNRLTRLDAIVGR